ncbi:hypothetical protein ACIQF6_17680 [Kitasatospora sp. NPDC092948]|uniref:hypothetical protein n=1 Tax=Kitasatospora sp. NPDC092948 TaxID=3364088 RepID=UPI003805FA8E
MKRPALLLVAVALATAGALTGCGSTHVTDSGSATGTPDPQVSASISTVQQEAEENRKRELAEADRRFPDIAKLCQGKSTAAPTAAPPTAAAGGTDPENSKYAENHAYLQTVNLTDSQRCRGEAHTARITAAAAKHTPADEAQARTLLTGLDYPGATLSASGDGVHFDLSVPGSGGCLSGVLSGAGRIEVHGVYLEGGCARPHGGH